MQKLQQVAPQMKAIQAKYKDDKQRQQQEIMKFYKENDINPFASFLPLVAQLPVFIGLFYTLRTRLREDICPGLQAAFRHAYAAHHNIPLKDAAGQTVACHGLNGSSWLFIHDLTNTATGLTLVVLILLYVGTQLASSLMMQAAGCHSPRQPKRSASPARPCCTRSNAATQPPSTSTAASEKAYESRSNPTKLDCSTPKSDRRRSANPTPRCANAARSTNQHSNLCSSA